MATAEELLAIARAELGTKESPAGSNRVKYAGWYGLQGQPWCMMFVMWVFAYAGVALPARTASCGALMRAAQAAGMWVTSGYRPGDVVIYDFPVGAATDHCGIVETATDATVMAIEGNTALGNDSDGGEVMRRTRTTRQVVGAVRPVFEEETEEDDVVRYKYLEDIPEAFRPTIGTLMEAGIIRGDGGDPAVIDLSHDQVRTLVFGYRGGAFDAKLRAEGLEPAVQ